MDFTEEEMDEIDRRLALADEDIKNGIFYTEEESELLIKKMEKEFERIYNS